MVKLQYTLYIPPPAACMATILGYLQMFPVPTVDPRHVNTSPIPDENLLCIKVQPVTWQYSAFVI